MRSRPARAICGLVMALGATLTAAAADYPNKPVRIVVNSAPGALLDATTRAVAQRMAEHLGQPVVVENNAGAAGLLGALAGGLRGGRLQ